MPLPPGTNAPPQVRAAGDRRTYYVDTKNTVGAMQRRGPFSATYVPINGTITLQKGTQLVDVEARVLLPFVSQAKQRSILTDVATNLTYEVFDAKAWADQIECFIARSTGDV